MRIDLQNIKAIKGGSYCYLYKALATLPTLGTPMKVDAVVKLCGDKKFSSAWARRISKDILSLRQSLSKRHVKTPHLYGFFLTESLGLPPRLVISRNTIKNGQKEKHYYLGIVEEYTGISVTGTLRTKQKDEAIRAIRLAIDFIKTLPEDIPLDINPNNITIRGNRAYLVDFMPPNPWDYQESPQIREMFEKLFPTTQLASEDKEKKQRYFETNWRLQRFMYYLFKNQPSSFSLEKELGKIPIHV